MAWTSTRARRLAAKRTLRTFRPILELLEKRELLSAANMNYVAQTYRDVLQREGEPAGIAFWTAQVDGGQPRTVFADLIDHSDEYFGNIIIKPAYRKYLARETDTGGLNFWVARMHAGLRDEQLEAGFIGSAEFYNAAGGTDLQWIDAVYLSLLGRNADPNGETFWTGQLHAGVSRSDVAFGFTNSIERARQRVTDDYARYLGRLPDESGVTFWVGQFAQGVMNEDIITGFVGSLEYYQRAQGSSPPLIALTSPAQGSVTVNNPTIMGSVTGVAALQAAVDSGALTAVSFDGSGKFGFTTALPLNGTADGSHTVHFRANDAAGNSSTVVDLAFVLNTQPGALPAPGIDQTVATTLASSSQFLYTGSNPIQTGVAPGTIAPTRVAVLRGTVTDRAGAPLPGVALTVLGHPEFGATQTRADGMFDMAVNGGGMLTINYARNGFLPLQRQVDVPWQDFAWLPDVTLIPADSQVTTVDLTATTPIQVARANPATDADGTRQATLLFSQGTQASMVLANGTTQPLTTLHVRATEYTVGASGPAAMPGQLPANSGYTYAVELNADEAVAAGATSVEFSQPVDFYVENFLNFPVGVAVPAGWYDRVRGTWVASDNGLVIRIVSETGGLADVDMDGDGTADGPAALAALGVTDAERERLATIYEPGQSLWRIPMTHFTPWDGNFPYGPPADATPPGQSAPQDPHQPNPKLCCGSIIEAQNQVLGETIGLTGTPFTLNYRSDRVPGNATARTLDIALSGASVPASLRRIELEVTVAGRKFHQTFAAAPNQKYTFVWDGQDAYGRTLQGAQPYTYRIGYVYGFVYLAPGTFRQAFAAFSGGGPGGSRLVIGGSRAAGEVTSWQEGAGILSAWDAQRQAGLGAWTLDVHHAYDPATQVLYLGDGNQRGARALEFAIDTVAGTGALPNGSNSGDGGQARATAMYPQSVVVAPDGSLYVADQLVSRVRRVAPNGVVTTVAGGGTSTAENIPATMAVLNGAFDLALGPDGSLYIASLNLSHSSVYRVDPAGIITIVAGIGAEGFSGDGGPANQAKLFWPQGIAVGPDGSLYIADRRNERVRRVGPDGIITTIAGTGVAGFSGDGGAAVQAQLRDPQDVAVGPDGSVFVFDVGNNRVRRVGVDGTITTVAGTGVYGFSGDGGPATLADLEGFSASMTVDSNGRLFLTGYNGHVRRIDTDGTITTVAGRGGLGFDGDGGAALRAQFDRPGSVAVGPDQTIYVADSENVRVRRIGTRLPGFTGIDFTIPSEDGAELYGFDKNGRHLRTMNALTGAVVYTFGYDAAGRLSRIEDGYGNVTTIERDANGVATAIVASFGQRTALSVNADGYLTRVANPAGEAVRMTYAAGGLLETFTEPNDGVHHLQYDARGRLTRDGNPAAGFQTLARTEFVNGFQVTMTTAENLASSYRVEYLPAGGVRRVNTAPGGVQTTETIGLDGSRTITYADGTVTVEVEGPDPRWGMQAPLITSLTTTTPGGLQFKLSASRTATLANPNDFLSLQTQTDTVTINGNTYTTTFDVSARTFTADNPEGRQTVTTIDTHGRVLSKEATGISPSHFHYDTSGRLDSFGQGTGATARDYTLAYDPQGNLERVTDPLSRVETFGYDPAGRVIRDTLPGSREVDLAYDSNGNVTSVTPPGESAHAFGYTASNLENSYTAPAVGPGSSTTGYSYNLDGKLTRIARPDGIAVDVGYNAFGRLDTVTLPLGQVRYAYNPVTGQVTTITAPDNGTLSSTYDGFLPTRATWAGTVTGNVSQTSNSNFQVASQSVNSGSTVAFQYDRDGLLTQAGALTLVRDAGNGLINSSALGNVDTATSYNSFGELESDATSFNSDSIFSTQYTRDDLGRITQKTETIAGVTDTFEYGYDAAGRLQEVRKNGAVVGAYTYDANGNRTSHTSAAGMVAGSYDAQDRLTQYGDAVYAYTANGELRSKTTGSQTTSNVYDPLGNLRSVTLPDGTQIEYVIDGRDRRIGKRVNGTLVQGFLYKDHLHPVAELDGNNNVVSIFVYGTRSNVPDYMIKGGRTYRIISDSLGSVRLVVDAATGAVAQRLDYDAFGNVLMDTNPGFQPFGFAGGLYDPQTKLMRFGVRDYDAETGRWTAKDPLGLQQGTNLYDYVQNNPINFIDPGGAALVRPVGPPDPNQSLPGSEDPELGQEENPVHEDPFEEDTPVNPVNIDERVPNNVKDPAECPGTRTGETTQSRQQQGNEHEQPGPEILLLLGLAGLLGIVGAVPAAPVAAELLGIAVGGEALAM